MTLAMMLKERHDDGRDKGRAEGIAIGEKRGVKIGERKGIAIGEKRGRAEGMAIGEKRGRTKGITEGKIETARNMLKNGLSSDLIIKCTGISAQQIKGLL